LYIGELRVETALNYVAHIIFTSFPLSCPMIADTNNSLVYRRCGNHRRHHHLPARYASCASSVVNLQEQPSSLSSGASDTVPAGSIGKPPVSRAGPVCLGRTRPIGSSHGLITPQPDSCQRNLPPAQWHHLLCTYVQRAQHQTPLRLALTSHLGWSIDALI